VTNPRVLFLDEPTTGLDPRSRLALWDIITGLVDGGTTVLLTTQYLEEADQLADEISVIDHGRVVAEGTSDELKASVGTASLHLRLADPADTDRALDAIRRILDVAGTRSPEAARITAPLTNADRVADLLILLREEHVSLLEMSVQKPTLDEVFLTITGHGTTDHESSAASDEKETVTA
jgi:ABC-2 type transport system ATP-binding protein